jgi:hypothetical protein
LSDFSQNRNSSTCEERNNQLIILGDRGNQEEDWNQKKEVSKRFKRSRVIENPMEKLGKNISRDNQVRRVLSGEK